MDPIQILLGGSLCISDELINFWEEFIIKKISNKDILKKLPLKKVVCVISYEPLVGSHSNLMWWFSGHF